MKFSGRVLVDRREEDIIFLFCFSSAEMKDWSWLKVAVLFLESHCFFNSDKRTKLSLSAPPVFVD